MRSPAFPDGAERIRTFDELHSYCDAYLQGRLSSLLIIGRPGVGKTEYFRRHADPTVTTLFQGHWTPLKFYCQAFHSLNKLLVLDDAERLWNDHSGRRLLRSLTEVSHKKRLEWGTTHKLLKEEMVPQRFETMSRLCMICNRFVGGRSDETDAILDRCLTVFFDPTPVEVYRWAAGWFWDQEILDFCHGSLMAFADFSGRMLVKAHELKQVEFDWKVFLLTKTLNREQQLVQQLEQLPMGAECRIQKFEQESGQSRATYYRLRRMLEENGQLTAEFPPRLLLKSSPPEALTLQDAVRLGSQTILRYRNPACQIAEDQSQLD